MQCENKKIHNIKTKFHLADNTVEYLWRAEIAEDTILKYIEQMIGKESVYPFENTIEKLKKKYGTRTVSLCYQIMSILTKNPNDNLESIKSRYKSKSDFSQLIFKMRRAKVNPITLESIFENNSQLKFLENPYNLVNIE